MAKSFNLGHLICFQLDVYLIALFVSVSVRESEREA
jgi:hypothetical protein